MKMHECEPAMQATIDRWNPVVLHRMGGEEGIRKLGPSHYLEEHIEGGFVVVRCIYCGEMWSEED